MLQIIISGGPFMMILFILFGIIIFISSKNIHEPYNTNSIVLLGIFAACIGIFATFIGINSAFNAIADMTKVSPQILLNGLRISLITSFAGGGIMIISTAIWFYFIRKHNLLVI
jgi:biopolymer transport protein ExbB/TolQ